MTKSHNGFSTYVSKTIPSKGLLQSACPSAPTSATPSRETTHGIVQCTAKGVERFAVFLMKPLLLFVSMLPLLRQVLLEGFCRTVRSRGRSDHPPHLPPLTAPHGVCHGATSAKSGDAHHQFKALRTILPLKSPFWPHDLQVFSLK